MKRILLAQLVPFMMITVLVATFSEVACANVTGACDNCHTMHNSQGGVELHDEVYQALLTDDCVGCHSSTTGETIKTLGTSTVPVVYNTTLPGTPLAGGNFYWVESVSDAKGHNIFPDNIDEELSEAPGTTILTCGLSDSCHENLSNPYVDGIDPDLARLNGKYGCEGCHLSPAHHADDTVEPVIDSVEEGWYRFLSGHESGEGFGVSGIEDDDWQSTKSSSDHNEYLGDSSYDKTEPGNMSRLGNTVTGFCVGCHGNFHIEQRDGSWIRHPSDTVIPNSGDYQDAFGAGGSGTGIYNSDVPVAREVLSSVSSEVAVGFDMVMCLSCHVPHGSPYDDLLRWDYATMQAGGGSNTNGCFACHTSKDGV